jgi:hypothetical protein
MIIFDLHRDVLADYRDFVRSFLMIADEKARVGCSASGKWRERPHPVSYLQRVVASGQWQVASRPVETVASDEPKEISGQSVVSGEPGTRTLAKRFVAGGRLK